MIEEGEIAINLKGFPPAFLKEGFDFRFACGFSGDGRLVDDKADSVRSLVGAKEANVVSEKLVVEMPTFEIGDG